MATVGSEPNGRATIREVYQLLDGLEERLDRKFSHLEDKIGVTMIGHQQEHASQRKEATARVRWLVGSVLGTGTLVVTFLSILK